jgi:hypothetical protein
MRLHASDASHLLGDARQRASNVVPRLEKMRFLDGSR